MGWFYSLCVFMLFIALVLSMTVNDEGQASKRNIVFIIADDLGWNDVSLHGSDQVMTPNIDTLGYAGVTLGRYYSNCVCTPSRSSLLTGKYAYTLGMQGYPLTNGEDRGLPITEKILPQYLKELGYATHLVGKWHVGSSRKIFLPTQRGFDSHFGHRNGYIDYYEYTLEEYWQNGRVSGLDIYRNDTPAWDVEGYATDVYNEEAISIIKSHDTTKPLFLMLAHLAPHSGNDPALLQAPPDVVRSMRHVELPERRIFAATMKKLDDSVGDVVKTLSEKGILNNTIIVFVSDNGGMTSGECSNYGNNYPLRGIKMGPFEGGVRVMGALWAPEEFKSHLHDSYFHVSDWLPTLLKAVGSEIPSNIDGHDLWDKLIANQGSSRTEIVDIDDTQGYASIIFEQYKLISGKVEEHFCTYQGDDLLGIIGKPPSYMDAIKDSKTYTAFEKMGNVVTIDDAGIRKKLEIQCGNSTDADNVLCYPGDGKVCLYNIKDDPCEKKDLSSMYPDLVQKLLSRLEEEKTRLIPRNEIKRDPRAAPALHNYTWNVFAD